MDPLHAAFDFVEFRVRLLRTIYLTMNDNLSQQTQSTTIQFPFNWWLFISQVVSFAIILAALGLAIAATRYCLRHHRADSGFRFWLVLIWLAPIVGPLCAFAALKRQASIPSRP
jgi:hypothetical protein